MKETAIISAPKLIITIVIVQGLIFKNKILYPADNRITADHASRINKYLSDSFSKLVSVRIKSKTLIIPPDIAIVPNINSGMFIVIFYLLLL